MTSHILWQNTEQTVTLLDVPRSIIEAQGFNRPDDYDLLSSQPRDVPYPSCEPKSAKARAKLVHNTVEEDVHAEYHELITQALQQVRQNYSGDWCLPRPFIEEAGPPRKKRKLSAAEDSEPKTHLVAETPDTEATTSLPDFFLSSLARAPLGVIEAQLKSVDRTRSATTRLREDDRIDSRFFFNNSNDQSILSISKTSGLHTEAFKFRVPPKSTFCLGDCTTSYDFRKAIREHEHKRYSRSTFDFILLDPPWPNRSLKRTHKTAGATYKTVPSLHDLSNLIFDMQLERMMAEEALVGVWITNKQAVRELVLGLGGLFDCWGVDLVEEWVWLKTTILGEPTSVLDALWKKPYEVLFLGRKRSRDANDEQPKSPVKRRVIIGVPDLHSRKPCLMRLVEPLVLDIGNYTALEVFARHLVAGWCSWGDECIKFNHEGYWKERESPR